MVHDVALPALQERVDHALGHMCVERNEGYVGQQQAFRFVHQQPAPGRYALGGDLVEQGVVQAVVVTIIVPPSVAAEQVQETVGISIIADPA